VNPASPTSSLRVHSALDHDSQIMSTVAELKRVVERALADPMYFELLQRAPAEALAVYGYTFDPHDVRRLVDPAYARAHADEPRGPLLEAWTTYQKAKVAWREGMRDGSLVQDRRYGTWRDRQKKRLLFELGQARADSIIHAPLAFELNKGCSVGCWFCGISAPKLSDIWPYTPENRNTWRAVLEVMRDIVGPVAQYGFCYWATDPLDNPDYERFMLDYHEILGTFPQTTTALALRDPVRTRALLTLSQERGCLVNRFSLITLKKFLEAHAVFSAKELLQVECLAQNNESKLVMANAGKAAERGTKVSKGGAALVREEPGTIACVSGFLFNMVESSVKLITPVPASERWPLGYRVLAETVFADVSALQSFVRDALRSVCVSVKELGHVRFASFIEVVAVDDAFELRGPYARVRLAHPSNTAWLRTLVELVSSGSHRADDIATLCLYMHGMPPESTLAQLESLLVSAVLDDEVDAAPAEGYLSAFSATPVHAATKPVAAVAAANAAAQPSAYLDLFDAPNRGLAQSAASHDYHARTKQASDAVLWLSRLRAPAGPGWRALLAHGVSMRGVLHVGAHYGLELESYIAAGFEAIVFVEPSPLVLDHLRAHVRHWNEWFEVLEARWGLPRRPRIEIIECAASNRNGTAEMYLTELEMLSSLNAPIEPWMRVQSRVSVECAPIDALLAEHGWSVADFSLLNIDVQGHEVEALDGAAALLRAVDAVLVELNQRQRYADGADPEAVHALLEAAGLQRVGHTAHGDGAVADAVFVRARA